MAYERGTVVEGLDLFDAGKLPPRKTGPTRWLVCPP